MNRNVFPSREALGLPKAGVFHRLLFNELARVIVVTMDVAGPLTSLGTIYWRKTSWRKYRPVQPPSENVSLHSAVMGGSDRLFFLATRFFPMSGGIGGDDAMIGSMHLHDGRTTYVRPASVDGTPLLIGELAGVSRTGRHLFCSVGFREKGTIAAQIVYKMSRLTIASGAVVPLTRLRGVFY